MGDTFLRSMRPSGDRVRGDMTSHSNGIRIIDSLKATIHELVQPIEKIQSDISPEKRSDAPSGLETIAGDLTMVVLLFTNADLRITDEETDLLNSFRRSICGDAAFALSSHDYIDMCRRFFSIHPNSRLSIDHKPESVQYLERYDAEHGTEYAEKAKRVFIKVAQAVVMADEKEQFKETMTFLNFKAVLYPSETSTSS